MSAESGDLGSPTVPPPPPPPALGAPGLSASESKKKLYQTIASSRSAVEGDHTEACLLLRQRESRWIYQSNPADFQHFIPKYARILSLCVISSLSFRKDLQWVLVNAYVPSLIQDGPQ